MVDASLDRVDVLADAGHRPFRHRRRGTAQLEPADQRTQPRDDERAPADQQRGHPRRQHHRQRQHGTGDERTDPGQHQHARAAEHRGTTSGSPGLAADLRRGEADLGGDESVHLFGQVGEQRAHRPFVVPGPITGRHRRHHGRRSSRSPSVTSSTHAARIYSGPCLVALAEGDHGTVFVSIRNGGMGSDEC
jgi:hypothetical protein